MIARSNHPNSLGFTLIEVLIALSLSVILAALLFSSLHTYASAAAAGQKHLTAKQVGESVYQFIDAQLRETVPLTLRTERERNLLFHGDERQVVFVGYIPSHRSAGGLHKNSLAIEGYPPRQSLVFSYARLIVDEATDFAAFADTSNGTSRTLITDANAIELEYFGALDDKEDLGWSTEWSRTDRLPQLVRIRIDRANKSFPDEIVVPIYANTMSRRAALTINSERESGRFGGRQFGGQLQPPGGQHDDDAIQLDEGVE